MGNCPSGKDHAPPVSPRACSETQQQDPQRHLRQVAVRGRQRRADASSEVVWLRHAKSSSQYAIAPCGAVTMAECLARRIWTNHGADFQTEAGRTLAHIAAALTHTKLALLLLSAQAVAEKAWSKGHNRPGTAESTCVLLVGRGDWRGVGVNLLDSHECSAFEAGVLWGSSGRLRGSFAMNVGHAKYTKPSSAGRRE